MGSSIQIHFLSFNNIHFHLFFCYCYYNPIDRRLDEKLAFEFYSRRVEQYSVLGRPVAVVSCSTLSTFPEYVIQIKNKNYRVGTYG